MIPASIEPGEALGGLVLQVYDDRERCLVAYAHDDDGQRIISCVPDVCLVVYDGTTGERLS